MVHTPNAGTPTRILVVDDERDNRALLDIILGFAGFVVFHAESGEEAIELVTSEPPDLVLLDVHMNGMDGYQAAAALKANPATRHIPILLVTALDDRRARTQAVAAGAVGFVTKPFDRNALCALIRQSLLGA